ncbi:hypothetical protein VTK56DRAFT_3786 [Thermocarpiscus australiensis]
MRHTVTSKCQNQYASLYLERHLFLQNLAPTLFAIILNFKAFRGLGRLVVNETEAAILGEVKESVLDDEARLERVAEGYHGRERGVADTTAAGDTFVGRYELDAVGKKGKEFDIEAAVRKANKAAAKTVERPFQVRRVRRPTPILEIDLNHRRG